jgi:hypothetical protein
MPRLSLHVACQSETETKEIGGAPPGLGVGTAGGQPRSLSVAALSSGVPDGAATGESGVFVQL